MCLVTRDVSIYAYECVTAISSKDSVSLTVHRPRRRASREVTMLLCSIMYAMQRQYGKFGKVVRKSRVERNVIRKMGG